MYQQHDQKRLPGFGLALFLCLCGALWACQEPSGGAALVNQERPPQALEQLCQADISTLEPVRVKRVTDGDTVRLSNGKSLRLIGINTPEVGRDGEPSQPLARRATEALQEIVRQQDTLWLQAGREHRDRHGRVLGHLFSADGQHVGAQLLRSGLAFQVAIEPNLQWFECLHSSEQVARKAQLGVWQQPEYKPQSAADIAPGSRGFTRVRGRVSRVSFKDKAWWLQLDGKVSLRIDDEVQHRFSAQELIDLEGREVEARGWLTSMRGGWWMMRLDHPQILQISR